MNALRSAFEVQHRLGDIFGDIQGVPKLGSAEWKDGSKCLATKNRALISVLLG